MIKKVLKKFSRIKVQGTAVFWTLFSQPTLRFHLVKLRYFFLKRKLKFHRTLDSGNFDRKIVDYNAVFHDSAFGCGGRMAILLYPLFGLFYPTYNKKLLIVGPRTEDDIIWAKAIGFEDVRGLDLFSYSPWIDIGDAHKTDYSNDTFDAVLLSWVLPYTKTPDVMIKEIKRITKNEGFLVVGWHWVSDNNVLRDDGVRGNTINSFSDVQRLVGGDIQMGINPNLKTDHNKAIFSRLRK